MLGSRLAPALCPFVVLACSPCPGPRVSPSGDRQAAAGVAAGPVQPGQSTGEALHAFASGPLIQNVYGRSVRSLNGAWRAIIDPYQNGYFDYRLQPQTGEGYFANRKPASKSDRVEYDFDRSDTLNVPGDWNSQRRELFFYEGTVWYKVDFEARPSAARRIFAHFGAANYQARVYANGKPVGEHTGGFTPFDVELTDVVHDGSNFLVVQVDNQRRRDGVPTVNTDWWNYGGLTRDVLLVDVPATFVRDYAVQLVRGDPHRLAGWVALDGPRAEQRVSVRLPEAGVSVEVRTDAGGYARFETAADVKLWSPEHPKLYALEIAAETDRVDDRIGLRSVETRGKEILLNGQPIFLRGISLHEQAPMREGRAYSAEDARVLLGWARELGANFVRLAHYPHNEHMVRLADELGLLVWEEIPVYWTIDWQAPGVLENAENQLGEVMARDRNRASVVVWSVGNETPETAPRLEFMRALVRHARALDSSRLIAAALERREIDSNTQRIDDPLGQDLDVLGCNEYLGWYDGLPDKADGTSWTTAYDKPLVMTEFGAGALEGKHGDALTRWTEEYQASVYEHQLRMLQRIPFLRGMTPWILVDFRSPRRPLPTIQDYWNRKGLISERGKKKQAFFVLQRFYEALAGAAPKP